MSNDTWTIKHFTQGYIETNAKFVNRINEFVAEHVKSGYEVEKRGYDFSEPNIYVVAYRNPVSIVNEAFDDIFFASSTNNSFDWD